MTESLSLQVGEFKTDGFTHVSSITLGNTEPNFGGKRGLGRLTPLLRLAIKRGE